jgi:hypothetical protein
MRSVCPLLARKVLTTQATIQSYRTFPPVSSYGTTYNGNVPAVDP